MVGEPTVRQGSTGDAVTRLQQALQRASFDPGSVDGNFGPNTEQAVRSFQSARGLTVDGVVGPQTWDALCTPSFTPADWNDGGTVQRNNNCYNYSSDIRTDTFAQPGRGSGHPFSTLDCSSVGAGAQADGLTPVSCDQPDCPKCGHRMALVIWPGQDFHWYRRDIDGTWSHKPGQTRARNVDNSGRSITDPRTADRGPYTDFCGCYCLCKPDVTIR
ncbi:MAG TPA: peptidoglycan-binding domain-containing protein [Chloroflexota bacterium]